MANISLNTFTLDFGEVTQTQDAHLTLELTNLDDNYILTVDNITSSNAAFTPSSTAFTIPAKGTIAITVTYVAGAPGAATGTLTVFSDATNDPVLVSMLGTSVAAGTIAYSLNPSSLIFPDTKAGVVSGIELFVIENTGTVAITITNVTFDAPFTAAAPIPGYPIAVNPATTLTFGATFNPVGDGYVDDATAIHVTSTAPSSPDTYRLAGMGVAITPVHSLTDFVWGAIASMVLGGVVTTNRFDPDDWDCETLGALERWHDFGKPGLTKTYYQMFLLHEDKGPALVSVNIQVHGASKTHSNLPLGDNNSNDILMATAENIEVYAQNGVIKTRLTHGGGGGPVSIVEIIHAYSYDDARVGTTAVPLTITPVFSLTHPEMVTIAAMGDASVKLFDPDDWNTEVASSLDRAMGYTPGFEESLLRLQLSYEDKGLATVAVVATNTRNQTSIQALILGTIAADDKIRRQLADLRISDDVIRVVINRAADMGQVSLTMLIHRFVPRGENEK